MFLLIYLYRQICQSMYSNYKITYPRSLSILAAQYSLTQLILNLAIKLYQSHLAFGQLTTFVDSVLPVSTTISCHIIYFSIKSDFQSFKFSDLVRDNVRCDTVLEEIFIKATDPLIIFSFIFSRVSRSNLNLLLLIYFSNLPQGIPSLVHQIRNY